MSLANTTERHGTVSIILHWTIGLLIIAMLALGWYMNTLEGDERVALIQIHKSIGVLLLGLVAFRVVWFFTNVRPRFMGHHSAGMKKIARLTHWLLLLLIIIMPVSGVVISDSLDYPIKFFDLFTLPDMVEKSEKVHDIAQEIHFVSAWVLAILIGLHVLASLKHHFIDRDGTLMRMLGRNK